jgi:flagellar protein FliS
MIPAGYATYTRTVATTVENKEDILLILFDHALTAVKKARMGIEDNNPKIKGESISQVLTIITELDCALDYDNGGELAENLSGLYHYIMDRLTVANLKLDLAALGEAESILSELQEGFMDAVSQYKHGSGISVTPAVRNEVPGRLSVAV